MHERLNAYYTPEIRKRIGDTWASMMGCQDGSGNDSGAPAYPPEGVKYENVRTIEIISKHVKDKNAKILDVGAADGAEVRLMIDAGFVNTIGITLGGENTQIAKEKYNIDILFMDMHFTTFKNKTFDAIVGFHTFEHTPSACLLLLEFNRILKIGGKVILLTPGCEEVDMPYAANPKHLNIMYDWQGRNTMRMCGFTNATVEGKIGDELIFYGEKNSTLDIDTVWHDIIEGKFIE